LTNRQPIPDHVSVEILEVLLLAVQTQARQLFTNLLILTLRGVECRVPKVHPHSRVADAEQLLAGTRAVFRPASTQRALQLVAVRLARFVLVLAGLVEVVKCATDCLGITWRYQDSVDSIANLEWNAASLRGDDPTRLVDGFGNLHGC
jgi:hypothetical protein